jgi:hypothetical protein
MDMEDPYVALIVVTMFAAALYFENVNASATANTATRTATR